MPPSRRARLIRRLLATAAVGVLGIVFAAPRAGTALVVSKPLAEPDAIVSLASHEWERLPAAAALAARFPRAVVVLTLPERVNKFNCHDCANRVHRLELAGVTTDRVRVVPLREGGTYGEALAMRRFVEGTALRRVLVVTSPYHAMRSLATFAHVLSPMGIEVGIEPATKTSPAVPTRWWATAYDRAYVRYEWAGIAYYAMRFGVPLW